MHSPAAFILVSLFVSRSFATAAHSQHTHRRSGTGISNGFPLPSSGPFAPGTSSVLYPAGNATSEGPTGTGLPTTTIQMTLTSTIYLAASSDGGSPFPAGGGSGYGGGASVGPGGLGESAATCGAPTTVTLTQDSTVTITVPASSSQAPIVSQLASSLAPYAIPSNSLPSVFATSAAASPSSAPLSSSVVQEQLRGKPMFPGLSSAPSSALEPSAVSSQLATVPVQSASTIPSAASSLAVKPQSSNTASGNSLTPNGIKAGVAGYQSITDKSAWSQFTPHIGWYSDYWPNTPNSGNVLGIPMLWGDGHLGGDDASRLAAFKALTSTPPYMLGFYEPDWTPPDSSSISSTTAATDWSNLLAPLGAKGTKLGSPSLATQYSETWLTPFENAPEKPQWDFTVIHTNKPNVTGVQEDVEYYLAKYKKPIWVGEFACVDDSNWTPCTDAGEIQTFIQDVVAFLQANESVVAYGYSNGDGLGSAWPMIDSDTGKITASGQVYLDVISSL